MIDGVNTPGRNRPRRSGRYKPAHPAAPAPGTELVVAGRARAESVPGPIGAVESMNPVARPTRHRVRSGLLDLRPDGPFRPPNYRWQLAGLLVAGAPVPEHWIDRWVLLAEEALTTPPGPGLHAPDLRAVAAARELNERGPYWRRVEVEARLLAGEPAAVIATKAVVAPAVVEAYAAVFYDIADRLRHPSYIVHLVVGVCAPGAEADIGVQVRLLGYRGGPLVLDVVLGAVGPGAGAAGEDSAEDREVRGLARLAVGLRATPVTEENAGTWAALYGLMRETKALGVRRG